jgi:site-specific DNA-methyltransferase (adenine-specific)
MKPGAHGVVWAYNKTQHWTMMALEDAGFEIRDVIYYMHGQGFPKGKRENGKGTLIKPSCEPWILVRKKMEGTVAKNYEKWGTGLINVDKCRIKRTSATTDVGAPVFMHADECVKSSDVIRRTAYYAGGKARNNQVYGKDDRIRSAAGYGGEEGLELAEEWDCVEGCPVALLNRYKPGSSRLYTILTPDECEPFFYCSKAARSDKNDGLDEFDIVPAGVATGGRKEGSRGLSNPMAGSGHGGKNKNPHPTVKPRALMRWLTKLITPDGGVVLDTFCGSGTTGVATVELGNHFIGIEKESEFVEVANARIEHWLSIGGVTSENLAVVDESNKKTKSYQLSLL